MRLKARFVGTGVRQNGTGEVVAAHVALEVQVFIGPKYPEARDLAGSRVAVVVRAHSGRAALGATVPASITAYGCLSNRANRLLNTSNGDWLKRSKVKHGPHAKPMSFALVRLVARLR